MAISPPIHWRMNVDMGVYRILAYRKGIICIYQELVSIKVAQWYPTYDFALIGTAHPLHPLWVYSTYTVEIL